VTGKGIFEACIPMKSEPADARIPPGIPGAAVSDKNGLEGPALHLFLDGDYPESYL